MSQVVLLLTRCMEASVFAHASAQQGCHTQVLQCNAFFPPQPQMVFECPVEIHVGRWFSWYPHLNQASFVQRKTRCQPKCMLGQLRNEGNKSFNSYLVQKGDPGSIPRWRPLGSAAPGRCALAPRCGCMEAQLLQLSGSAL